MPNRKSPKRKAKDRLERLVKAIVRDRDNRTCQRCGKFCGGSDCHASHVIPVSRDTRLAFEPMNLKVLCFHCHLHWWHKHPCESGQWFRETFPDRWQWLEQQHKENTQAGTIPLAWYHNKIEELKRLAITEEPGGIPWKKV